MDWSVLTAILGVISGGAGLLFYKERKRGEQIKNEMALAKEWHDLYNTRDQDVRERDAKIDRLYVEIAKWRDKDNQNTTEIAVLKMKRCDVVGCNKREPPRGF